MLRHSVPRNIRQDTVFLSLVFSCIFHSVFIRKIWVREKLYCGTEGLIYDTMLRAKSHSQSLGIAMSSIPNRIAFVVMSLTAFIIKTTR